MDLFESQSSIYKRIKDEESTRLRYNQLCFDYDLNDTYEAWLMYLVMESKRIFELNESTYSSYHM